MTLLRQTSCAAHYAEPCIHTHLPRLPVHISQSRCARPSPIHLLPLVLTYPAGYVTVDETRGRRLFYYFVEVRGGGGSVAW